MARSSVLLGLMIAGCGRIGFDPSAAVDAGPLVCGPWTAPVRVAELSSTEADYSPAISADGLSLMLQSEREGLEGLYEARRQSTADPFDPPELCAQISSPSTDSHPTISSDGLTLYFLSDRGGEFQLYVATRPTRSSELANPQLVASTAGFSLTGPSLSGDGTELFVTVTFASADLGHITGLDQPEATLDLISELNTAGTDGFPSISGDGLALFWEGNGGNDIMTADRPDRMSPFGPSRIVTELMSNAYDGDPELSKDGRTIWFVSDREGNPDIFMATRDCQ
ncbi:MAG: TolB family protein [Kofleriaceae bacterium]